MIQIFSPIDSRGRKKAILKCIAEIKKQYKVKETKKYLLDKLNNLSDLNYIKNININFDVLKNEFTTYERLNEIVNIKISKEFIEKILDKEIENKLINSKTIFLILSTYLEIETLKAEEIYNQTIKAVNKDLESLADDIEISKLTDYQIKEIDKKFNSKANVLSIFKKSIAYYYYVYFKYTKEEAENIGRDLSLMLFDDSKKANFTREYFRDKEFLPPTYFGKYISFC